MSIYSAPNRNRFDPYGMQPPAPDVLGEAPNLNALYGIGQPPQAVSGVVPALQNPGLLPAPVAPKTDLQNPGLLPAPTALTPEAGPAGPLGFAGFDDREKKRGERLGPYTFM